MHATLCDLMMDLLQNSVEANATEIELTICQRQSEVHFTVKDNGQGMSQDTQQKAIDPFYSDGRKHAHRRVGLGLPFLLQTAETVNGRATIASQEGHGTTIAFYADANHVDLPPVGDVPGTLVMMLTQPLNGNLKIVRRTDADEYTLSRNELIDTLGELTNRHNLTLLKRYVESQENHLEKAGIRYE